MSDRLLIESDVIEAVTQYISSDYSTEEMAREDAELLIGQIPSADRPQGEWIWHEDEDICNCSECEFEIDATGCIEPMEYVGVFHFCPNCGAKMKGASDDKIRYNDTSKRYKL